MFQINKILGNNTTSKYAKIVIYILVALNLKARDFIYE